MATPAEASHNLPPEAFLTHYRTMRDARRAVDEAAGALLRAQKAAKAAGVDMKALKLLEDFNKIEPDEAGIRLRHWQEYAHWTGQKTGTQATLFPAFDMPAPKPAAEDEQTRWAAGEAGYMAGKGGALRGENPFPEGTPLFVAWDKAFLRGLSIHAADLRARADTKADRKIDRKAARGAEPAPAKPEGAEAPARRRRTPEATHDMDELSTARH